MQYVTAAPSPVDYLWTYFNALCFVFGACIYVLVSLLKFLRGHNAMKNYRFYDHEIWAIKYRKLFIDSTAWPFYWPLRFLVWVARA
jgi:hypothetical protein